jgi:microcystin-dependent protein
LHFCGGLNKHIYLIIIKTIIMKRTSIFTALVFFFLMKCFSQPVGSITAFAGPKSRVPAGWVFCDGKLYDKTIPRFTGLFNTIGTSWGGDGANKFAVPDLRGQFLRGVSDDSNTDPEANSREKSRPDLNSSGNGGNAVGSKQLDDNKAHEHAIQDPGHSHVIILHPTTGGGGNGMSGTDGEPGKSDHGTETAKTGITKTELNSGKESRPKNAYVLYIIKL